MIQSKFGFENKKKRIELLTKHLHTEKEHQLNIKFMYDQAIYLSHFAISTTLVSLFQANPKLFL